MPASLEDALERLEGALGLLEAAVSRRLEVERRRGDLETELQLMQDDRARLAVELDGATARLNRNEAAARDVGERVQRAVVSIQDVLAHIDHAPERTQLRTPMPQVNVTIAGRAYRMACGEGEEAHLEGLAALYDGKIQEMRGAFGEIGDMRLQVMAALTVADELNETKRKLTA